jgi:hypothetical protein
MLFPRREVLVLRNACVFLTGDALVNDSISMIVSSFPEELEVERAVRQAATFVLEPCVSSVRRPPVKKVLVAALLAACCSNVMAFDNPPAPLNIAPEVKLIAVAGNGPHRR